MNNKNLRIFWFTIFFIILSLAFLKVDDIQASFYLLNSPDTQETIKIFEDQGQWTEGDFMPELPEEEPEEEQVEATKESDIFGYIVEFEDEPLIFSKKEAKESFSDNEVIELELKEKQKDFEIRFISNKENLGRSISNLNRKTKREFKNVLNGLALDISAQEVKEIEELDFVKKVYPDYGVSTLLHQSAPLIGADQVWDLGYTGEGVKVAIIDTGIDYTHWAFGGCTTEEFVMGECGKIIGGYDFVNNDNDPMDDHGHGTHVAGIVSGHVDLVMTGIAPDAQLLVYKTLNSVGDGTWSQVIAGIEQAYIDGADVINLSLGGPGDPDDPIAQAVDNIVESGVIAVVAAGNSGSSYRTINTPGVSRKAITVGASSKTDVLGSFSSRGPVIWDNKSLIKPDVLAPGVLIDSAVPTGACSLCDPSGYKALNGTSMAAPHVAGVVALMRQVYPDWSPEEIKMVLRNTSVDLNYDYVYQGHGRVDALGAIQLTSRPPLAEIIENSYEVLGEVDIIGTATSSNNFVDFSLYYGKGFRPLEWELICNLNEPKLEETLCSFDTSLMDNGEYLLKLEVEDDSGQISRDYGLVRVNNLGITSVGDTNNYIKSGVNVIKGYIHTPDLEGYKIEARIESGTEWQEICHENELLAPDILCSFDATGFENGKYDFRISATINGDIVYSENHEVAFIEELMDNWPIKKNCFREIYVTPIDLIDNGQKELLSMDSLDCGPGWSSAETVITILGNNVDKNIHKLYKDGNELRTTNHLGSLPLTILSQGIFTPLSTYIPEHLKYFGVIDDGGNFKDNWPYYDVLSPTNIISSSVVKDNKIFNLREKGGELYLYGLNEDAEMLDNFPIIIEKESGLPNIMITRQLSVIVGGDGEIYIGFVFGSFNNWTDRNAKLYFDIYSVSTGARVNRTLLSNDTERKVDYSGLSFAAGDLNNDGNSEVAVSYMVVDYGKSTSDPDRFSSYLKVIDLDGIIISEPLSIKQYSIKNIRLGDLGRENIDIVFQLSDTLQTTYNGQQVVALDYLGDELFNVNMGDYYKLIEGISIGDVTGDGQSNILVAHRSRWWDGKASGILIYDINGNLEKEIIIPTIVEVEYLSSGADPIIIDLDNNGYTNIALKTNSITRDLNSSLIITRSHTFVFETDALYNPKVMSWPMFGHDPQNTNLYGVTDLSTNLISIDGQTESPYEIDNPTPEVIISGEEGMMCRWADENLTYSNMSSNEEYQCEIDGLMAICNLTDQGEDGEKTIYVSCQDYYGIDQVSYQNLQVEFLLTRGSLVEEPQISTSAVSGITTSSVVLNGNINSLGDFPEVAVYFEWKRDNQSTWQQTTSSNKSSIGSFNQSLSGLSSNTTYQARAVVEWESDGLKTKFGSIREFTTARESSSGGGGGGSFIPSDPLVEKYNIFLKANPVDGGIVQGAGSYPEDGEITVSAQANNDFLFLYWQEGQKIISQNPKYTFMVKSDRTLTAVFAYTVDKTEEEIEALVDSVEVEDDGVTTLLSSFNFVRNLTLGSTGEDVRQLQILLNSLGFLVASSGVGSPGNETAYFGSLTQQALARFQATNNISPAVGYFGPITRAFIERMSIPRTVETPTVVPISSEPVVAGISEFTRNLTLGSTGEDVRQLQILLNSLGFLVASSGVGSPGNETAYFGSLTQQAVIRFQERYAQEVLTPLGLFSGTGFVGGMTRNKLNQFLR